MKFIKKYICFILSIFTILISTTSCSNETYAKKEEYVLEDKYEIYENVKYYYSSLGMIAMEIVDKTQKEVTIYPEVSNTYVYSVATDFLKDNEKIETLNLPCTDVIYETKCISNCPNLKEINLKSNDGYGVSSIESLCEKKAFNLPKDCYFYLYDVSNIQHYIYAYKNYASKIKLLNPVQIVFSFSSYIAAAENNYFEEKKTISFSVKGKMFGIIDIDVSQSKSLKDPWYCQKTIQVIDDVDFFIKNGKKIKEQSFEITTSTYILAVKNIIIGAVTKDYPVSYSKTNEYDRLTDFTYYSGSKPNISSSFSTRISYVNEVEL